MRFPYSVVCALFAMPESADLDITAQRRISTFQRAAALLGTISGRQDYSSASERFEDVTMLLFQPLYHEGDEPQIRLYQAGIGQKLDEISETEFFSWLRRLYNLRNPHAPIGDESLG